GESIWIPSGKSRVLHIDGAIRRVSIGNPDLAGIVVLGPRTIMVNAKEAPRSETGGGGGSTGTVSTVGTITGHTLTPQPRFGESIWIPSGKSRVLHIDGAIRRVSIGNPDLAGIVVLGPRTIMVNAKEAPRSETGGGGGSTGTVSTVGTITGHTLTPEPRFGET